MYAVQTLIPLWVKNSSKRSKTKLPMTFMLIMSVCKPLTTTLPYVTVNISQEMTAHCMISLLK